MASKYWIKLWIEMLEDPKMGPLPDNLWRRAVELFLLAGEVDAGGKLPTVAAIAWKLRHDSVTIRDEMLQLCVTGIITQVDNDNFIVTNFAERQKPIGDKERKQYQRKRENAPKLPISGKNSPILSRNSHEVSHENVTKRDIDTDTDTDNRVKSRARANDILSDNKELGLRLTKLCGYSDPQFVVNGKLDDLAAAAVKLAEWKATPDQLDAFGRWWWGKTPPTFRQVIDEWGKFLAAQTPQREPTAAPPLDDARRAAYLAMLEADRQAAAESAARVNEVINDAHTWGVDVSREVKKVQRRLSK